jgi:hypothetical protein
MYLKLNWYFSFGFTYPYLIFLLILKGTLRDLTKAGRPIPFDQSEPVCILIYVYFTPYFTAVSVFIWHWNMLLISNNVKILWKKIYATPGYTLVPDIAYPNPFNIDRESLTHHLFNENICYSKLEVSTFRLDILDFLLILTIINLHITNDENSLKPDVCHTWTHSFLTSHTQASLT